LPDEVEPDGMPNVQNIPVSTLKSNIFYHLGLAYYLDGDLEKALEAWRRDISLAVNDDMMVATLHWVYMTLREMGREEEAVLALAGVTAEMNIIENMAYHRLCLFYKGEMTVEELTSGENSAIMNDAMLYGLGNWYLYNSDLIMAKGYFEKLLSGGAWASFGYIAAEVKSARL
jgi:tetratricopeptide (TPR) repeat protein